MAKQKHKWRNLEKIVAQIENRLKPKGAVVKFSHRRRGPNGRLREVDATIEYRIGTIPILIFVECRDWKAKQGIKWIEQLVTKRENLGAQQVVAVSSSGFSRPAIEEANKRSIELRLVNEVDDIEIESWTKRIEIRGIKLARRIKQFQLSYYDQENKTIDFAAEVKDSLTKNMVNTPIIVRYTDDLDISLQNIIDGFLRHTEQNPDVLQDDYRTAVFNGEPFVEIIKLDFPRGEYYNTLGEIRIDVKQLEIHNFVIFDVYDQVPIDYLMNYSNIEGEELDQIAVVDYNNMTMFIQPGRTSEGE